MLVNEEKLIAPSASDRGMFKRPQQQMSLIKLIEIYRTINSSENIHASLPAPLCQSGSFP